MNNKEKNKPLIIYGTGDTATLVYEIAVEAGLEVAAFTSDDVAATLSGGFPPCIKKKDLIHEMPPEHFAMTIGFIGKKLHATREARFNEMKALGYDFPNIIQPGSHVSGELGAGNIIFTGAVVGPRCKLGNLNILWQNCVLPHDNVIGSFNNIAPTASLSGYSQIGNHCFIGNGSQINNFVKIGDWTLIGAGAYANKDVEPNSVLVPQRSQVLEGKKGTDFE